MDLSLNRKWGRFLAHIKTHYKGLTIGVPIGREDFMLVYSDTAKKTGFFKYRVDSNKLEYLVDKLGCSLVEACIEFLLDKESIEEKEDGQYILARSRNKKRL